MPNSKISNLDPTTTPGDNDLLAIVDVSVGQTKRVTKADLLTGDATFSSINGGSLGRKNLVCNPEFKINQRGATSRTEVVNAYNFDRWYYDGTYLYQLVEDIDVRNGDYVLSWSGTGISSVSWVISTNNTTTVPTFSATLATGDSFTVSGHSEAVGGGHLWLRFGGTVSNLDKVQLERGSTKTPFEQRGVQEELLLCERFYQVRGQFDENFGVDTTYANYTVHLPTKMRAAPTVVTYSFVYSGTPVANRLTYFSGSLIDVDTTSGTNPRGVVADITPEGFGARIILDPDTTPVKNIMFSYNADAEL